MADEVKREHFMCDCDSHMLVGRVADLDDLEAGWEWLELAIWEQVGLEVSLWERLRHIRYILLHGHPYIGFASLDLEQAERLHEWLGRAIQQMQAGAKLRAVK
jgi:hypothetical protein